jgi:hypothetical protein
MATRLTTLLLTALFIAGCAIEPPTKPDLQNDAAGSLLKEIRELVSDAAVLQSAVDALPSPTEEQIKTLGDLSERAGNLNKNISEMPGALEKLGHVKALLLKMAGERFRPEAFADLLSVEKRGRIAEFTQIAGNLDSALER